MLDRRDRAAAGRMRINKSWWRLWPVWVWAVAAPAYTWRKTDLSRPEFAALLLSLTLVVALVATAAGMARRSGEPAPVWLVQAIVWPIVLCALVLGFSLM